MSVNAVTEILDSRKRKTCYVIARPSIIKQSSYLRHLPKIFQQEGQPKKTPELYPSFKEIGLVKTEGRLRLTNVTHICFLQFQI